MPTYLPDVKFIASIYPGKLPEQRFPYGPSRESVGPNAQRSSVFRVEPVARGGRAFVFPVYDSFQDVLDIAGMSGTGGGVRKAWIPKPVPVQEIVRNILKIWTEGMADVPSGMGPGIIEIFPMKVEMKLWESEGKLPGPTPLERERMADMQTGYFEYLFTEGERLHKEKDWKSITDTMRLAADWLGYEREWSHKAIARDSGPCPWCQTLILNAAIVCHACGKQVRDTPAALKKFDSPRVEVTG